MSKNVLAVALIACFAFELRCPLSAQSPPSNGREFEVASIRPSDPHARAQFQILPGGTYVIRGATLSYLIQQAYGVRDYQISGGPSWLNVNRYDIAAKTSTTPTAAPSGASANQADLMALRLQTLLASRFHLQIHRETKELRAYSLVIAKGGSKLTENHTDPSNNHMERGVGHLKGTNASLRFIALTLSRQVDRTVINETGLTGTYDFELNWIPEARAAVVPDLAAAPREGPDIFTALERQLGLKLVDRKGPVERIVIDRAEPASEN